MRPDAPRVAGRRPCARALLPALLPALLLALLVTPALGADAWDGGDERCDPPLHRAVVQLGASQTAPPAAPIAPAPPAPAEALALDGGRPAASGPDLPAHRPRGPPGGATA
jgi:hypothetical protein